MTAEIERFIANSKQDAALQAAIAQRNGDLDSLVGLANERGYRISRADADAYIAARSTELEDGQLDHVAGGGHKKKASANEVVSDVERSMQQWKWG